MYSNKTQFHEFKVAEIKLKSLYWIVLNSTMQKMFGNIC